MTILTNGEEFPDQEYIPSVSIVRRLFFGSSSGIAVRELPLGIEAVAPLTLPPFGARSSVTVQELILIGSRSNAEITPIDLLLATTRSSVLVTPQEPGELEAIGQWALDSSSWTDSAGDNDLILDAVISGDSVDVVNDSELGLCADFNYGRLYVTSPDLSLRRGTAKRWRITFKLKATSVGYLPAIVILQDQCQFYLQSSKVYFYFEDYEGDSGSGLLISSNTIAANQWIAISAEFDPIAGLKLTVNGVSVTSAFSMGSTVLTEDELSLNGYYYQGFRLQDVEIFFEG